VTPPPSRREDALWYRVLDRFGLPTLMAVLLLGYVLRQGEAERSERRELLAGIRTAIETQTITLRELAAAERAHADAVAVAQFRLPAPRLAEGTP
jgi:hypothetical protein